MNKKACIATGWLASFVLWTIAVCNIDVARIGPRGSAVGFATINAWFHHLTGVHMTLYTITDWLGLVPVAVCLLFAVVGLWQWITRKHIGRVDVDILMLAGFYIITIAAYLLFESVVINYRPILIAGYLEASYPSSTTLLVLCVMPTALWQVKRRIHHPILRRCLATAIAVFATFMVTGRLLSGVHWLSDIIGGVLCSVGLVCLYDACCCRAK